MKQTTPKKVNGAVRAFCRDLSDSNPRYVPVMPIPHAQACAMYCECLGSYARSRRARDLRLVHMVRSKVNY